jgi:SAM-dependent methyltransferase
METRLYKQQAGLEDRHWWYAGRRAILETFLRRAIGTNPNVAVTTIGCGTGAELEFLSQFGSVQGVDLSPEAVEYCRRRGYEIRQASATDTGLPAQSADLVTAFDLLEHVDDDRAAIREFRRLLRPGGHCLVTVPAIPSLWSPADDMLHHRRRYTPAQLQTRFEEAGFVIERLTFFNLLLFFPAVVVRRIKTALTPLVGYRYDIFETQRIPNAILTRLFASERYWLASHDAPVGLSLLLLARPK